MATFCEIAAHSVNNMSSLFCLFVVCLFFLPILVWRVGFFFLIAPVPDYCLPFTRVFFKSS